MGRGHTNNQKGEAKPQCIKQRGECNPRKSTEARVKRQSQEVLLLDTLRRLTVNRNLLSLSVIIQNTRDKDAPAPALLSRLPRKAFVKGPE